MVKQVFTKKTGKDLMGVQNKQLHNLNTAQNKQVFFLKSVPLKGAYGALENLYPQCTAEYKQEMSISRPFGFCCNSTAAVNFSNVMLTC